MTTKHTPEPWEYVLVEDDGSWLIRRPWKTGDRYVDHIAWTASENACTPREALEGNAQRICACVNACEGINPDAVPKLLEACKHVLATLEAADLFADRLQPELRRAIKATEGTT